jgi:phosphate starvation-inducible membrane PsiE
MDRRPAPSRAPSLKSDGLVLWVIVVIEYAIVVSLLLVAGIVLVRSVATFVRHWSAYPDTVITAIDGILVVIILIDLVNTVFRHMRSSEFPVRPFIVIGILAGVREILSASARLALSTHLKSSSFHDTIITLGIGVGVVLVLVIGLYILNAAEQKAPE